MKKMKTNGEKWVWLKSILSIVILFVMIGNLFTTQLYGNTPGEVETRSRDLQKIADRVYESAVKLFDSGKFWEATQELIVIIDYFPQFNKIDGVYYYTAQSLNELEMNKPAIQAFKWLIDKHPQSKFAPYAYLGLQKIAYRQEDYKNSVTYYYTILKKYSESKVLNAARYYAGQSLYNLKQWDQAILLLKRIGIQDEFYDYSLYTTALCMIKKKEFDRQLNI